MYVLGYPASATARADSVLVLVTFACELRAAEGARDLRVSARSSNLTVAMISSTFRARPRKAPQSTKRVRPATASEWTADANLTRNVRLRATHSVRSSEGS